MTPSSDQQGRMQEGSDNDGNVNASDSDLKGQANTPGSGSGITSFSDLPPELRAMIWRHAMPGRRVFDALTYVSAAGLQTQLLYRSGLRMPLAHLCFESRRVVQESGYVLAFALSDQPDDPGVWFHPQKDVLERTIWAPGDIHHQQQEDGA